ncbi:MAG: hypothetical protein ACREYF_06915 [Gammaproteobacteria bacterium]
MTKTKSVDPAVQGVRAWNALDNILPELRLGVGISPTYRNAAAPARDWVADAAELPSKKADQSRSEIPASPRAISRALFFDYPSCFVKRFATKGGRT